MGKTRRTSEKREIVFYQFILVPRAAPPDCCAWKTFRVQEGCHGAQSEDKVTLAQQKWPRDRISAKSISKCGC